MPLQVTQRRKKLALDGELTIYFVREAAEAVLPKIESGSTVLDLANVSELDSAGLQLLLKARRVATQAGRELEISAASPAVREALDLVHCDELRHRLRGAA